MFQAGVPYELKPTPRGSLTLGSSEEMTVSIMSEKGDLVTVFHLRKGGCLRGPVDFYTRDGKPLYHVDAGQSVPSGCDRH